MSRFTAKRLSCLALLLLAAAMVAGALLVPRLPLLLAQRRWAQRPFDRYAMVAEVTMVTQHCKYSIVVDGELITAIHDNWCDQLGWGYLEPLQPRTVDDHLRILTRQRYGIRCGSRGCRCGHFVALDVVWDAQLGYPVTWRDRRIPALAGILPPCPADVGEGPVWRITRLEPLDGR